jgi:hypothetical protein
MNYSKPLGSGVFSEASVSACSLILCMVDLKSAFFLLILYVCLHFSQKDMVPYIFTGVQDPDSQDQFVFGTHGSGSIIYLYGFDHSIDKKKEEEKP